MVSTSIFSRPQIFDPAQPLTAPTLYVTRLAETAIHHNRVSAVAFVPDATHAERHVVTQSAVLADYDCMATFLRTAGYHQARAAHANSTKAAAKRGNAFISTLTEVWVRHE